MAYRYHPEIEGLKVNEDGTEVRYRNEVLEVKDMERTERATDFKYINLNGGVFSIAKLVCECWNGMSENPRWCATRKVKEDGFHYRNLEWKPRGFNPQRGTGKVKRSSLSNLTQEDIAKIEKRIKKGDTLRSIAADYATSDMSISRIKKKMQKRKK